MSKNSEKPRVVIMARVSSDRQDVRRQVADLKEKAESKGWRTLVVLNETISASKTSIRGWEIAAEREMLDKALKLAAEGRLDKVMVHEVSRIARRNSDGHRFLERMTEMGVSIYWLAQDMETLIEIEGKLERNPAASLVYSIMLEQARAETETLSRRIRSGMELARKKGKHLGRPPGAGGDSALLAKYPGIVALIEAGVSQRKAAKAEEVSPNTVYRVVEAMKRVK